MDPQAPILLSQMGWLLHHTWDDCQNLAYGFCKNDMQDFGCQT